MLTWLAIEFDQGCFHKGDDSSTEIGIDEKICTNSGGLRVLAGDTKAEVFQ